MTRLPLAISSNLSYLMGALYLTKHAFFFISPPLLLMLSIQISVFKFMFEKERFPPAL